MSPFLNDPELNERGSYVNHLHVMAF
jgi:hypothetical protein